MAKPITPPDIWSHLPFEGVRQHPSFFVRNLSPARTALAGLIDIYVIAFTDAAAHIDHTYSTLNYSTHLPTVSSPGYPTAVIHLELHHLPPTGAAFFYAIIFSTHF